MSPSTISGFFSQGNYFILTGTKKEFNLENMCFVDKHIKQRILRGLLSELQRSKFLLQVFFYFSFLYISNSLNFLIGVFNLFLKHQPPEGLYSVAGSYNIKFSVYILQEVKNYTLNYFRFKKKTV